MIYVLYCLVYLLIGLILIGIEKRWKIPYSIFEEPVSPIDKILVFIWPVGLLCVLLGIIVKIIKFFFNGFRWPRGAK